MDNTLKLPVGIENFEDIRKLGFYYIDKTKLIEQLLYKHYEQKVIILIDKYDVPLDDYRRWEDSRLLWNYRDGFCRKSC